MKIGFDAKRVFHNQTGLGNYSRDILRGLAELYPEHMYWLYNPKPGKVDRLKLLDSMKVLYPKSFYGKRLSSLWRQKGIVKDLVKDEVEIFHGLSNELPKGIDKTSIKTVVTIHDLIFIRFPELYKPIDRKIHFEKFKRAAHVADVVIAISEQTKNDIIEFLKIPKEKIKVVYQGCHQAFKEVYTNQQKETTRTKFSLPKKFILSVGTIEKRKNVLLLLKAVKDSDLPVVLVGKETQYAEVLKKYIEEHQMQERVFFLKGVSMEELAMIYQLASVFVYPSVFEGFGIPIIEALYSKTPVVTTAGGCFPEAGGPFSVYVDSSREEDLKNKIELILTNHELSDKMAEKSWEYVQQFNDDVIVNNIMSIYKELC